jgi:hypothetical protein
MRRRLVRVGLALVMILLVAATPLSAHLSGGIHETWVTDYVNGKPTRVRLVLFDGTGLVRAISPGDGIRATTNPHALVVRWYTCGSSELALNRAPGGFVLSDRSMGWCVFANGQAMVIHFAVPIDRTSITFDESGEWIEPYP